LRSRGPLRIPRVLGCSDEHRVLAFEWLAGDRLSDLVVQRGRTGGEPPRDAAALVGTALAALHAQPADGLPRLARAEEARQWCARAEELAHTCPPLAERAALLAHRLAALLRDAPTAEHPIHGDFYAKQVLLDGGRVGIIDLDQAARGDPAFDLGRFIAHVERAAVRDGLPARHVADLTRAFLDGYQAATGRPAPDRVGLYVASGRDRDEPATRTGRPMPRRKSLVTAWSRALARLRDHGLLLVALAALALVVDGCPRFGRQTTPPAPPPAFQKINHIIVIYLE